MIGATFIVSGYVKATAPPQEFAMVIELYDLVPTSWALAMAHTFPWAELFLGAFLITGYYRRQSAAAAGGFLVMFIGALVAAQARGIDLAGCGCFGKIGPELKLWQSTLLDVVLAGLALAVWKDRAGAWTLDRWIEAPGRRR